MSDILYGVKLLILKELDPATQLAKAGGIVCRVETAASADLEPLFSSGNEKVLRTDDKILAIAKTEDLLYGYTLKFKDNVFDVNIIGLVEGGTIRKVGQVIVGYDAPMMSEGCKILPFLAEVYVANYEGDSIVDYTKVTLNNCKGKTPKLTYLDDFFAPEFEVSAREASKAGKPVKSIDYIATLPPVDTVVPVLTMITVTPIVKPAVVIAKSNKLGGIYLVLASAVIDSIGDLAALVNMGIGSYASILAIDVNTNILTASVAVGTYKVYAVDIYGNISVGGANIVIS